MSFARRPHRSVSPPSRRNFSKISKHLADFRSRSGVSLAARALRAFEQRTKAHVVGSSVSARHDR